MIRQKCRGQGQRHDIIWNASIAFDEIITAILRDDHQVHLHAKYQVTLLFCHLSLLFPSGMPNHKRDQQQFLGSDKVHCGESGVINQRRSYRGPFNAKIKMIITHLWYSNSNNNGQLIAVANNCIISA